MKKTYKPPTEVAGPVESVGSAAPSSPEGGSETGNTPVSVELPMQVLKRKAPVVNVHPLPPQPDEEVAASQSEPSVPGVQRPTQVLSRKTGAPVPPPPKDAAHAVSQAPELKGEVVQAESQDSQPQAPELKTDTSPISKQGMDIAITTHASIDPVVSLNEVPKRKKGFFASLLDWFKKNS